MLAVAFDTLKLARKLESAGMQPKQAQDTSAALQGQRMRNYKLRMLMENIT